MATLGLRRKNNPLKPSIHNQDRDVLGARACTRCHGYIERSPVFIISVFESLVRCVNCGRLYRRLNSHLEKYPSNKREWDEVERKTEKATEMVGGNNCELATQGR